MNEEGKLDLIIEDFVEKSWFYLDKNQEMKVVNVENLIKYIEYLKEN